VHHLSISRQTTSQNQNKFTSTRIKKGATPKAAPIMKSKVILTGAKISFNF
jgi:hypothetical protein